MINRPSVSVKDIAGAPSAPPATKFADSITKERLLEALREVSSDKDKMEDELEETKKKVRTTLILDSLIEPYAKKTYYFMCSYCLFVAVFLLMDGFECFSSKPESGVLQILVGSTAVTVIGLVGMVLTGIYVGAKPRLG